MAGKADTTNFKVPTLPSVVQRLAELIDDPDTGIGQVAALVGQDPPLAGKVLRIANSTFYSLSERCTSVEGACAILGMRTVRAICVQAAVIQQYAHLRKLGFDLEALWRHSVLVAHAAKRLATRAKAAGVPKSDEAYLAGLLHDVGQMVLLDNMGELYVAVHQRARAAGLDLAVVEENDLGLTHADIGASVATSWSLSKDVRAGILLHHTRRAADLASPAVALTRAANLLVERACADDGAGAAAALDAATLKTLGLAPSVAGEVVDFVAQNRAGAADAA
jgi:HD-like signal output (HDOD) protein